MHSSTAIRILAVAGIFTAIGCKKSSDKYLEQEAIAALDATTETIGNMSSCSLRITNERTDIIDGQAISHVRESDVYLRGANQLHIYARIDDTRKGFWYNGKELAVYRFDEGTYDITKAPPTTMAMIDSVHKATGIDFPAADVFYPTLTDDVIANFDSVFYLGTQEVQGVLCKTVFVKNDSLEASLFIDDATNLPMLLAIYGRGAREGETYQSFFEDWQVNPALGDEIFEFSPPQNAKQIAIFKKR